MTTLKINSDQSMLDVAEKLVDLYKEHKYLRLAVTTGKERTVDMNRLWNGRYSDLATYGVFNTFPEARAHCKLEIGIPILERDREGFSQSFRAIFGKYSYEERLRLMLPNRLLGDGFPVTSEFTIKQGREYIENISLAFPEVPFRDLSDDQ